MRAGSGLRRRGRSGRHPAHPRPVRPAARGTKRLMHHVPLLEWIAERLQDAVGAGPEVCPASMLSEGHRLPDESGKVNSFSGGERRFDQLTGRHLVVCCHVRKDGGRATERLDGSEMGGDSPFGGAQVGDGERPPSAADVLPDCSFCAVDPVASSDRDGRAAGRSSGHAIELHCKGSTLRKHLNRLGFSPIPSDSRSMVRASNTCIELDSQPFPLHRHLTDLSARPPPNGAPHTSRFHPFRTVFSFAPAATPALAASNRSVRRSIAASISATFCCSL